MFFRISALAIVIAAMLGGSAQAQVRSPLKLPDPRGEFVRLCAPHMLGRWAHPPEEATKWPSRRMGCNTDL